MASTNAEEAVLLSFSHDKRIAIITLNLEKKLNALTQDCYFRIATLLQEIAKMDDVLVTILTGKGRFFSAGADVTISRETPSTTPSPRRHFLSSFVANNLHNTHAVYTHPKILITALNGPCVGLSAALTAHSDFIYAAPHAYFLTPFSSLGLVAEGGSSRAVVERMGISLANEALIMSKRIGCQELLRCGYVNEVFREGGGDEVTGKGMDSGKFLERVVREVEDRLVGGHLNGGSLLGIKRLIRKPGMDALDRAGLDEVWGGLDMFVSGVPQEEFAKIASGAKKHKL